ncbi:fimbrial protein [Enterobacter wuhouensis]|uniref:fimbrial protein n=1 Tax=Enterobacter wuhouensis TaxID=2529381 RepID=UPI002FD37B90
MFKYLTHRVTTNRAAGFALASVLLSLSQTSQADECHFGWYGEGGTTTLVNGQWTQGPVRLPSTDGTFTAVGEGGTIVPLSPGIQVKCNRGTDGDSLYTQTAPGLMIGNKNQRAIFATNIPGIGYAVYVHTDESGGGYGGFFGTNTTGWQDQTGGYPIENWANKWMTATIYLFVGPSYKGNPNKATVIKPQAGTLGKMGVGDPTASDHKPWTFMVDENSFQIPIVLPTCDTAMVSGGNNTVNLGDYFASDIINNKVKDIPFTIELTDCTSVAKFTTKLTTTKVTGTNNDLLANTLPSEAEGAGVKIIYNGTSQLIPNNANSTYIITDENVPNWKDINLIAQLVPNGSTVKPGSFKATGTFTLSYD